MNKEQKSKLISNNEKDRLNILKRSAYFTFYVKILNNEWCYNQKLTTSDNWHFFSTKIYCQNFYAKFFIFVLVVYNTVITSVPVVFATYWSRDRIFTKCFWNSITKILILLFSKWRSDTLIPLSQTTWLKEESNSWPKLFYGYALTNWSFQTLDQCK